MNNMHIIRRSIAMILALVLLLSIIAPTVAQASRVTPCGTVPTPPSQGQGPTDPAELEAFLDELLGSQMEKYHIAGAAVSVVKDGKLFFAKGYGYADLEKGIPIEPEQTVFRLGSIGKLFTWTAVMQLVEQGKLDLDADINTYLDFRIPDTYPQPITLKHLLTHTSGFENRLFGSLVTDANDLLPVREFLISHMSARVLPPGDYVSYSNYNAMLAGYIVARVSGQPYEQYIQEHIMDPLGMAHSTARWSNTPDMRLQLSVGYRYVNGAFQPFPDYLGQPAGLPSGAHQASVVDMARFMIAHLQDGRYSDAEISGARILKEATARQMHSTQYTPDPRLLGMAYGFFDLSDNGQRAIGHAGYLPPMRSLLLLFPDQNLGVFVVYNSTDSGDPTLPHIGFQREFFDHYYPAPAVEPIQPPADFAERAGRFVGSYRTADSLGTTYLKFIDLLFGSFTVEISDSGDGALLFRERRFVEVAPLYFRHADGPFSIVFREDEWGRIAYMSTDFTPDTTFVAMDWYETRGFNLGLALSSVFLFLFMIPVAAIRLTRDRRLSRGRNPSPRGARVAVWIILGICVLNLLFLVGSALWGWPTSELHSIPMVYRIVLGLGVLSAGLTIGALAYTVLSWKNSYWSIAARLYYTLVTIAAVAFVWFLNYWNLLGWRY